MKDSEETHRKMTCKCELMKIPFFFTSNTFRPITQHSRTYMQDKCFIITRRFTVVFFVMDMDYNVIKETTF